MKKLLLIALAFAGLNVSAGIHVSIKPVVNGPTCNGGHNGTINLVVTGGTAPYSYSWSNSLPASASLTGLAAGSYSVTVTDHNGISASYHLSIAQPAAMNLITTAQNVSVHGGSDGCIHLTVDGGTPEYQYEWNNHANVESPCGLSAGYYTVTVTDAFGCTSSASKQIYQPSHVTAHPNNFNGTSQSVFVDVPQDQAHGEVRSDMIENSDNSTTPKLTSDDVTAYPNPASDVMTLRIETGASAQITLVNTVGQTVMQTKTDAVETRLDLSNVAKGNYIAMIRTDNGSVNKMISIIK